ncbi:phosphoribosyltransferase [Salinactinospora qingdaonensis]|uniref:Phosphoribosyltransferase family protein n=1 Tax=Salinactinospora qingdaonensis TaxID=702744 RepID=A0ABP7FAM5_9ACTN
MIRFRDRAQAGARLAERLRQLDLAAPVVLALPRGGVGVAAPVAEALAAPLHVVVARKVRAPNNPEFAVGAVTATGPVLLHSSALKRLGLSHEDMAKEIEEQRREAERRVRAYQSESAEPTVAGRDVLVIDDGLATGATAAAALSYLRGLEPASLRLAVPVGSAEACRRLDEACDEVICLHAPYDFGAVSLWYAHFPQYTDQDVVELLREARQRQVSG